MAHVQFIDPGGVHPSYTWAVNPPPDGISPFTKLRQIQRTSNTGNVGATKQQGETGPVILNWTVNVFHQSQQIALWEWLGICDLQTIYISDWEGNTYEGQIIEVGDQWVGALGGPGDTDSRLGYSKMTFQFEVYRFISGYMAGAGVTP